MLISFRTAIAAAALVAMHTSSMRADLVSVGTVGSFDLSPSSQSSIITVPVFNDTGTSASILAWTLGFRIVPVGGATGSVTINESSFAYPTGGTNIFPTVYPTAKPASGDSSPGPGDYTASASDGTFTGVLVPNSAAGKAMMTFQVSASADASGTFALQLVDSSQYANTFWNDENGDPHDFLVNNAAFVSGVEIGQFNVAAAVPEPGSLLLTGTVALIAGWRARRKGRAAAAAPSIGVASELPSPSADIAG